MAGGKIGINKRITAVTLSGTVNQNVIEAGIEAVEIYGEIQPGVSKPTFVPTPKRKLIP